MDVLLIGIAALSLILTIGMGLILFKVIKEDRQRSNARVALLAAAAANVDLPLVSPAAAERAVPNHVPSRHDLFVPSNDASPWPRRAAVAAALALVVATASYLILPPRSTSIAAPVASAPLELLALKHTQDGKTLTVTGSVRNPRVGAPQAQVFATAVLFGRDGNFLTSGRAALDFTALAPGDESPFVIAVPVNGTLARYRVGFRAADGSVIAHVDRRSMATAAAEHSQVSGSTPWAH